MVVVLAVAVGGEGVWVLRVDRCNTQTGVSRLLAEKAPPGTRINFHPGGRGGQGHGPCGVARYIHRTVCLLQFFFAGKRACATATKIRSVV